MARINTPELANAEVELVSKKGKFTILKNSLARVANDYDYIIIDSPPSLSLLTVNGMIASNYLLLPVQTEFYALEGVAQLLESMKLVMKQANPNFHLLELVLPQEFHYMNQGFYAEDIADLDVKVRENDDTITLSDMRNYKYVMGSPTGAENNHYIVYQKLKLHQNIHTK